MQSPSNKLIVSVAGSGKTTYLVRQALNIVSEAVLITTYTEANEKEIRKKFYEINGSIPANITIQTWFSFLLQHGARPYQGNLFGGNIRGMLLVNEASGINYRNSKGIAVPFTEEKNFIKHYFAVSGRIYSDKLSKFVFRCNEKSNGMVIQRLAKIFGHLLIDEVQDLAGNDLELLRLFFKTTIKITLVGDPRQVTYLTHNEKKNRQYKEGKIKQFIVDKCKKDCVVDEVTLRHSHRNNKEICDFSSKLYPDLEPSMPCDCAECRNAANDHSGIFLVRKSQILEYCSKYSPTILRYQLAIEPEWNFGNCKGLGFDRVLIYPTEPIIQYLKDGLLTKMVKNKSSGKTKEKNAFDIAKLYVALTRARYSVAIVYDYNDETFIEGITKW
ncbi:UvrD-helicase domain-containing protein [Chryseobacterium polytrichastri]|uniref:DNA 3'-5' helicase II n=1 Tax=Chryseobacterium polytrichastri TaxID=1302687 RepID=A0A1M7K1W9_9FLAO|nr:UvrD-helicase domain-containing protein [Chryseobacterium polytrichastri]SHM59279.1 UvrD/REP helicase N-terminal domain-containing protein [Chryseobacterium polytrichastri]